ncbi:50S ribosomal protein L4 [bioreactor metagenome]|uniref:50S ribosomal protein L4 n=1 Tax=bioreactor metagenome TaxID=1076179 RepID=A0A645FAT3_9ZZZZ|nr:50S ribosomal protein L4 [Erysipelotrichaceae bacterium]
MAEKKTISAKVLNQAGEEVSKISLKADVWGIEPNKQVMFDAVQVYQSNSRQATAKTKVRHEVSGGGKKPWRQKGTGRARAGSSRSPIWVGGGTVFGPDGTQNFKLSQNKTAHRLALKSALSMKTKDGLIVVDKLELKNIKTKEFRAILKALKAETKVLVVVSELEMNLLASANNINWVKVVSSENVSVYDLMNVDAVVIEKEAVKELEEALA